MLKNSPIIILIFLCLAGCSNRDIHISFTTYGLDNICLSYNDTTPIVLHFNDLDSISTNSNDTFSVKNIIDKVSLDKDKRYEVAYNYCLKGYYPLHIKVSDKKGELLADTTIKIKFPFIKGKYVEETTVLKGNLCPYILYNSYNGDRKQPIRGWLFDNGHSLDSLLISKMEGITNYLCGIAYPTYCLSTKHSVPRFGSIQTQCVSVKSNLHADRYFLIAASSETPLVEEIRKIIIDKERKGLVCNHGIVTGVPINASELENDVSVFIVGVNNNGNYSIIPVGVYIIDHNEPTLRKGIAQNDVFKNLYAERNAPHDVNYYSHIYFNFRNLGFIISHKLNLKIDGNAVLSYGNFEGNGVDGYDVPFSLNSAGDIKTIEIYRTKGNQWGLRPGKKTINVDGKTLSNYHFDFILSLRIGDNYVPIVVTDMRGNKTKIDYHIPTSRIVSDNSNNYDEDYDDIRSKYDELEERVTDLEDNE